MVFTSNFCSLCFLLMFLQLSDCIVFNNQFRNCTVGVFISEGQSNKIIRNKFRFGNLSVHVDHRGETVQRELCEKVDQRYIRIPLLKKPVDYKDTYQPYFPISVLKSFSLELAFIFLPLLLQTNCPSNSFFLLEWCFFC